MAPLQRLGDISAIRSRKRYLSGKEFAQEVLKLREATVMEQPEERPTAAFTTIDDAIVLAEDLLDKLIELGKRKHPFHVRRGSIKRAREIPAARSSQTLKASGKTYFFDIKKGQDGGAYLVITESRFKGVGNKRERTSIVLFPEHAQEFLERIQAILPNLCR